MSVISCFVLALLCFSHACNARSLGVMNKAHARKLHSQKKQENDDNGVSIQHDDKSSLAKVSEVAKKEDGSKEVIMVSSESKDHGNKDNTKAKGVQNESLASVSCRVPNKRREDPEPGFNLDYLPPETHPPVHN